MGAATLLLLCPSCGHDQALHTPDSQPPYTCDLAGCQCSRTPDGLLVEAPTLDDDPGQVEPAAAAPADLTDCPLCGGYGEITTRRNFRGVWETRPCTRCDGTGEVAA